MVHPRTCLLAALSLLAAIAAGCQTAGPHGPDPAARDGVFVHVSKGDEDPHAVLMALQMANLMSPDRDVLVYFDVKGIGVVLKDAKDLTYPSFDSSKAQLAALIRKGVPLYVCPGCLKAAGKQAADVMPGVKVAEKDAFFDFTKGRILTLDY
jgi:predicted peroxiredoxin